jgi:cysteine dioxygenase
MAFPPLDHLLTELDRALAQDSRGTRVAQLLEAYAAGRHADWRPFALFEATYYCRNLVRFSDLYELIVLCWGPGQRSPIHDHAGQRCWMAVLEGTVRETLFQVAAGPTPSISQGAVRDFRQGSVGYVVDDVGWHRIEPVGHGPAVTLHLYSRPIRECRIFDEELRTVRSKKLVYHSIGGVVQAVTS